MASTAAGWTLIVRWFASTSTIEAVGTARRNDSTSSFGTTWPMPGSNSRLARKSSAR